MVLKSKLKEYRARYNLNQEELANKVGVSRQMISLIEREKIEPSVVIALRISKFFEEPLENIFEIK
ncbi:TPA: helix-turn-helix transcriptional regulator [Streptococcus equi subsp. zooepidemicus]|nr:helix-turn-helix transcriptional regulator [Streptococcus equi subsp. zooepidemicus]